MNIIRIVSSRACSKFIVSHIAQSFIRSSMVISLLFTSFFAQADGVDMASIYINGKLVRRMTRNQYTPYEICLKDNLPGDTLSFRIWTDYGGEKQAYILLINQRTGHADSLSCIKPIILTNELLQDAYQVSVVYLDANNEEWDRWLFCVLSINPAIENCYRIAKQFKDVLMDMNSSLTSDLADSLFMDSIQINFRTTVNQSVIKRIKTDTTILDQKSLTEVLRLNPKELIFLKKFDPIDHLSYYANDTHWHGNISFSHDFETFVLSFQNYNFGFKFHFKHIQERYVLSQMYYNEIKK